MASVFIFLAFAVVAFAQRSATHKFTPSDTDIADYEFQSFGDEDDDLQLITLEKIEKESALIVSVKATGNRETSYQSTLSEVVVEKIYKGDFVKTGDHIFIYEPIEVANYPSYSKVFIINGYLFMREDNEYILFLEGLGQPDGYKYDEKESITFKLVKEQFGKYCLQNEMPEQVVYSEENNNVTYKDIAKYAIYTSNKGIVDKYLDISSEVLNSYQ